MCIIPDSCIFDSPFGKPGLFHQVRVLWQHSHSCVPLFCHFLWGSVGNFLHNGRRWCCYGSWPTGGPSALYWCPAVGRGKPYEGSYASLDQQELYYDSELDQHQETAERKSQDYQDKGCDCSRKVFYDLHDGPPEDISQPWCWCWRQRSWRQQVVVVDARAVEVLMLVARVFMMFVRRQSTYANSWRWLNTYTPSCQGWASESRHQWQTIWPLSRTKGLSSEQSSFLFQLLHQLLPTQDRINTAVHSAMLLLLWPLTLKSR